MLEKDKRLAKGSPTGHPATAAGWGEVHGAKSQGWATGEVSSDRGAAPAVEVAIMVMVAAFVVGVVIMMDITVVSPDPFASLPSRGQNKETTVMLLFRIFRSTFRA
jgi:hypothetical protein